MWENLPEASGSSDKSLNPGKTGGKNPVHPVPPVTGDKRCGMVIAVKYGCYLDEFDEEGLWQKKRNNTKTSARARKSEN